MSGFKNITIAGVGFLGGFVLDGLKGVPDFDITVFTTSPEKKFDGVKTVVVDYSKLDSVTEALKGQDVVVSTLSGGGFGVQSKLADAAKKAGVKLFVPSEFGSDTFKHHDNILATKQETRDHLKEIGLPYVAYINGVFEQYFLTPFFGYDIKNKKAEILGSGEEKISTTNLVDIGRYVGYTLLKLPLKDLENRTLTISGDVKTKNEGVEIINAVKGVKLDVSYKPLEPALEKLKANDPADGFLYLAYYITTDGLNEPNDNGLFPGWNPVSLDKYAKENLQWKKLIGAV